MMQIIENTMNPSLLDEFLIFRYRKKMWKILFKSQKKETETSNMSLISMHTYEMHETNFIEKLEKLTSNYCSFWDVLSDVTPDLKRFIELGMNITSLSNEIDLHFNSMFEINPNLRDLNLYSKCLNLIIQDKVKAQEVCNKYSQLLNLITFRMKESILSKKQITVAYGMNINIEKYSQEGTPCIFVSGEIVITLHLLLK